MPNRVAIVGSRRPFGGWKPRRPGYQLGIPFFASTHVGSRSTVLLAGTLAGTFPELLHELARDCERVIAIAHGRTPRRLQSIPERRERRTADTIAKAGKPVEIFEAVK